MKDGINLKSFALEADKVYNLGHKLKIELQKLFPKISVQYY